MQLQLQFRGNQAAVAGVRVELQASHRRIYADQEPLAKPVVRVSDFHHFSSQVMRHRFDVPSLRAPASLSGLACLRQFNGAGVLLFRHMSVAAMTAALALSKSN